MTEIETRLAKLRQEYQEHPERRFSIELAAKVLQLGLKAKPRITTTKKVTTSSVEKALF